ncbi:MAG: cyclic nucleotide-binding domain-containing protein [bacterium]|nr:cyclic nucleotide-binding domain-containing protein [bacterium]
MKLTDRSSFIKKVSFLGGFSDGEIDGLLEKAELKTLGMGELLYDSDDQGDIFYIVYKGKIRIFQKTDDGEEINLGLKKRGEHFGEASIISGRPRDAAARAAEESRVIAIPGEIFHSLIFSRLELREYFDTATRQWDLLRFFKSRSVLSAAPLKELEEFSRGCSPEFHRKGAVIFRQGAEPEKLYCVEQGKIKVVRWENGKEEIINFLKEGDIFGEKALYENSKRHADVVCLNDCSLLAVSKETVNTVIKKSKKINEILEKQLQEYTAGSPETPYEDLIAQELAADARAVPGEKADSAKRRGRKKSGEKAKEKPGLRNRLSTYFHQNIRFPFIKQHDEMSCGITCLMIISRYYGKSFASSRLHELAHVDLRGSSIARLASAAEQLGFLTKGMKLNFDSLLSVTLPCIVHWQGRHFVVVYKATTRYVWVSDPAIGLRRYTRDFFEKNWTGIALLLDPTPRFDDQDEERSSFRNFFQFVAPYKVILFEIFIASLLLNIFGLASPIFTQNIVDKVLAHHNISMLNIMLVGMLLVIVFRVLTMLVRQYLIIHTAMKIDLRMLVSFFRHMLALPLGYFKVRKIGDFITRFGENLNIRRFLTNTAMTMILDTLLIVVYLSLMFYYNVKLTGLALLFIPFFVILTLVFTPILKRLNIDSFAARVESESHLIESINAIDTVKTMSMEFSTRWKWEDKFLKALNIDYKLNTTAMYFNGIGDLVGALSSTIILWYGAHQVMDGNLSVGQLMAFMSLLGSVMSPINRLITVWDDIQQTLISIDRINDVLTSKPELPMSGEESSGLVLKDPKGGVLLEDVYFRYGGDDDPYILSKINCHIEPGQTVAIVGRSGSGKTTLVKLIARLYNTTEGRVKIDGVDIKNINLINLRSIVGFVLQDSFVFNTTIRENISMGDADETMKKVIESAELANAHEFISTMPLGYETRIGESGLQLSGGQRQRIAIARVLYQNPRILIFDEATSSLDTESEQAIQQNMKTIFKDKTAIIISHRLSTVRNADVILVLDKGEVVEQGTHKELMKQKGLYYYLNQQQLNL